MYFVDNPEPLLSAPVDSLPSTGSLKGTATIDMLVSAWQTVSRTGVPSASVKGMEPLRMPLMNDWT